MGFIAFPLSNPCHATFFKLHPKRNPILNMTTTLVFLGSVRLRDRLDKLKPYMPRKVASSSGLRGRLLPKQQRKTYETIGIW